MKSRSVMSLAVAALLGILPRGGVAQAPAASSLSFSFTSFDYPGAISTQALATNQNGIIVGYYLDANSAEHGFVRSADGQFKEVDYPGAVGTILLGINDSNEAVGLYNGTDIFYQGFIFEPPNQFTPIYYGGLASETTPYGINNNGQIVGAWSGDQIQGGFSLLDGTYTDLLYPNAEFTNPDGVNSAGVIVGSWVSACSPLCRYHGFMLTSAVDGTYTDVNFPGSVATYIDAINDSNEVVGAYGKAAGGYYQAWVGLPSKNQYAVVAYPGAIFTALCGINNARHIVGYYIDANNMTHGFLAVPK
jgi:uncharacterized membrane protein